MMARLRAGAMFFAASGGLYVGGLVACAAKTEAEAAPVIADFDAAVEDAAPSTSPIQTDDAAAPRDGGPATLAPVPHVACGDQHTCARRDDGTVLCWGSNAQGQLGNGAPKKPGVSVEPRPVAVVGLANVVEVSAGASHTCARLGDGTVRCWGANFHGQLGNGTVDDSSTAVAVTGVTDAVALSLGESFSCALLATRETVCWGDNRFGQLGDNSVSRRLTPVKVQKLSNVASLATGSYHTCARTAAGGVACWGLNDSKQLGDGESTNSPVPRPAKDVANAQRLATGALHSCLVLADQTVSCWGANLFGEVGQSVGAGAIGSARPLASPLATVTDVALGAGHSCALRADGSVWCWGDNALRQLGLGEDPFAGIDDDSGAPVANVHVPGRVVGGDGKELAVGANHTCVYRGEKDIVCWGAGASGQLGDGKKRKQSKPSTVLF